MTISRRGIFGVFAGAAVVAKAPVEQSATTFPTAGVYHEGWLFLKHGHRAADPVLFTEEIHAVPRLWVGSDSAKMARIIGARLNKGESS